jgi:hypothetical protein
MEVRKERLFFPFFANALEVRGVSPSYAAFCGGMHDQ